MSFLFSYSCRSRLFALPLRLSTTIVPCDRVSSGVSTDRQRPAFRNKKHGSSGMTQTSGVELPRVGTQQHEKQGENTVSRLRGAAGTASWSEIRSLISRCADLSDYVRRHFVATGDKSHVGSVEWSSQ